MCNILICHLLCKQKGQPRLSDQPIYNYTIKNDRSIPGPAPGRPFTPIACRPYMITLSRGACRIEGKRSTSPAAAVPVSTKIPLPIIAPIPSAVRLNHPSVLFSLRSGWSASEIS